VITLNLMEAEVLPLAVSDAVKDIAEEALQAAFKLIADRLESLGYPVSGDIAPWEAPQLDNAFQGFVLMMALNNDRIGEMQEDPMGVWL
jgi:hypothetical protein